MSFKLNFYGSSEIGKVRQNNEDSYIIDNELSLAIVADGMGGHKSGEIASSMAVKIVLEKYSQMTEAKIKPLPYDPSFSVETNRLKLAVNIANTIIYETSQAKEENKGMGTTLTACLGWKNKISIIHVGDSRAYLFRQNSLHQLSSDHSLVMEQVRKGIITKEQAENSSIQNILTKALGTQNTIDAEIIEIDIMENDKIMICSDGLFKCVKENRIREILQEKKNCEEALKIMMKEAYDSEAPDNVTIVIGKIVKLKFKEKLKNFIKKLEI